MKHLFLFLLIASGATSYAQTTADSAIKVSYSSNLPQIKQPAYYLNGQFIGSSLQSINIKMIENITVLKEIDSVNGVQYNGKILITTKANYVPKLISLNEFKFKYTNIADKSVLFMIDGGIVNADYDKYLVDENNVFHVFVDEVNNPKEKLRLVVVKLLTKTDENIKNYNEVRIRSLGVPVKQ
ncbi:hypothetical protein [Pinibacter aurantiacus]|uniref:DUF4138 domain-containing protein n=1 Tax=Pinibacter aurantiacus TaxID=2851599 RepID=A0A9E2S6Q3_9BACT|nr:hypothetical protein [Pinibacter aurantiacus]MBV4357593.1 hypothetical protein [Pinibacter aurantiacus]